MSITQFSNDVDEILGYIKKLHHKSFGADFNEYDFAVEVAFLKELLDDIVMVKTKDEDGMALTDEDGRKVFTAAELLELDRIKHIYEIAEQKLLLLEKLAFSNFDEKTRDEIHSLYNSLQAKEEFFSGKGKELAERLDSTLADSDNVGLVYGPLIKNVFTEQYEDLVKGMISGQDFKLNKNPKTGEYFVKMNGQNYHLTNILKYANLAHLTFNQQDCDNYLTMLATKPMAYKPDVDQSDAPKIAAAKAVINRDITLSSEEKKRKINGLIDNVLLQSIENQNNQKPADERDNSLAEISTAERLAINIWTTGFFDCANPFLRGDIEGTFERTRAMSDLVGGCRLALMSDLPASGPEPGKLYVGKNEAGDLVYTVRTPQNRIETDQILKVKGFKLSNSVLTLDELSNYEEKILAQTSKRGHTAIKKNGREDALRELLCTTAFAVHGASYVSPDAPLHLEEMYRGDDGLNQSILEQRLDAVKNKKVISLNNITSTSKENPNVDFAFNSKTENKSKVKIGSVHNVIGKDISAISAYKREKEFISISRHKLYEGVIKSGDNEYLFKVRDVAALNQLAPEELLSKDDLAAVVKRDKELKKKEKSILSTISKSKRKEIQAKIRQNERIKEELIQRKVGYLTDGEQSSNETSKQTTLHLPTEKSGISDIPGHKRKRSDSVVESALKSTEEYISKKMRTVMDIITPPSAQPKDNSILTPVNDNVRPSQVHNQTMQTQSNEEDKSTNPLSLPSALLKHLEEIGNELNNQQPVLTNSRVTKEPLMLRQYKIYSAPVKGKPSDATVAASDNNKNPNHKRLR